MSAAPVSAAMSAPEFQLACNSLAHMAFDLKDLVNVVAAIRNPGPFQVHKFYPHTGVLLIAAKSKKVVRLTCRSKDILDEFNDISDSCLSNISLMIRSSVITIKGDQQLVYEAYSYVGQVFGAASRVLHDCQFSNSFSLL